MIRAWKMEDGFSALVALAAGQNILSLGDVQDSQS
jgi:hypothetical protein